MVSLGDGIMLCQDQNGIWTPTYVIGNTRGCGTSEELAGAGTQHVAAQGPPQRSAPQPMRGIQPLAPPPTPILQTPNEEEENQSVALRRAEFAVVNGLFHDE